MSLFVHEDLGVVVHDARTADSDVITLVGVEIPFIVFLKNEDSDEGPSINVSRKVMSDFVGELVFDNHNPGPYRVQMHWCSNPRAQKWGICKLNM